MHLTSRIRAGAMFVGVLLALASSANAQGTVTLQDLLDGGSIIVDDKEFFDFRNFTTSGTLTVDLGDIDVFPIFGGPNNDEPGLRFQSTEWSLNGANQSYDLGFDFSVRVLDSSRMWIHDNTLEITGNVTGMGDIDLVESVTDHATDADLANKIVFVRYDRDNPSGPPISDTIDHHVFPFLSRYIDVSKDFRMRTYDDPTANVFVSHFDQTFSQVVPEPSSALMVGLGATLLGMVARRRRLTRTVD